MSKESFLAAAYPETASEIVARDASDLELVEHALRKWEHLVPSVLKKHGIKRDEGNDLFVIGEDGIPDSVLEIDAGTCSLCEKYVYNPGCKGCPLAEARNGVSCGCCADFGRLEKLSPYEKWMKKGDPKPMIKWLKKARDLVIERGDEPMSREEYVRRGVGQCPACRSGNISGGEIEVDVDKVYQEVGCEDCHASWHDEYVLAGYTTLIY